MKTTVPTRRREEGAALFVAVMMLVMMGMLGLAALETVSQDGTIAGFQNRARTAFYAAEAGLGMSKGLVRTAGERSDRPGLVQAQLGDGAAYPYGRPEYAADPEFADPIRYVLDGPPWAQGGDLRVGKQRLVHTLWQVNVQGATPDGTSARVEAVLTKLLASGYGG